MRDADSLFAREELRKRFVKAETTLFRVRYDTDKSDERRRFLNSRDFNWIEVRFCGMCSICSHLRGRSAIARRSSFETNCTPLSTHRRNQTSSCQNKSGRLNSRRRSTTRCARVPSSFRGRWLKALQVRWTRVPDLVERRKVFLKKGWAYVPAIEQSSIVFQAFESHLMKDLEVCSCYVAQLNNPNISADDREMPTEHE